MLTILSWYIKNTCKMFTSEFILHSLNIVGVWLNKVLKKNYNDFSADSVYRSNID